MLEFYHKRDFYEFIPEKIVMNAFFKTQFNYCPVVCMPHSHKRNNNINRLHERCLYIIYNKI